MGLSAFLRFKEELKMRLRECPKDRRHKVFGTPFSFGGREFVCPDCGIEWHVSRRTKKVKYLVFDEMGKVTKKESFPLNMFPEIQRAESKNMH